MPFLKLQFKPGVNRDQTNYTGEGGWWDIDKVRFFSGFPQKIGGWQKYTTNTILGTCRQMWNWITTFSDNLMALGTNKKVYIDVGGSFSDITPLSQTTAAGDVTFSATNGSSTITVTDSAFPSSAGSYVTFSGAVSLGGNITAAVLNQNYEIATITGANTYTIIAKNPTTGVAVTANVSDSGNGGAAVVGAYEITTGNPGGTYGYGWGSGGWGGVTSGSPSTGWGLGTEIPVDLPQRDWWFDNFDNDLVMNIRNGAIYYWERGIASDPSSALATRASLLSTFASGAGYDGNSVPTKAMQVLVSQQDKHLIAFGAVPYGSTSVADFDPLLIRWASQDEPFQWTPTPTNSSGFLRVSRGSRIVRALATRQEILIWTDSHLYTLQYLGTTDVFTLQEYADNVSIMSPRAVTSASNITYWMGQDKFYAYTGRVETLPCTIRQYIFGNFNYDQSDQVICGTNEQFNEVWWFYPSAQSLTNNKYVIYNHLEKIWYYGDLQRTAWIDSPLREYPQAVSTNFDSQIGTMYNHESGVDSDGAPMESYIQSNDFDVEDGYKFVLTKRIIPDVSFSGSQTSTPQITMKIRARNFPGSDFNDDNDDTVQVVASSIESYTQQVFMRVRARQIALRLESDTLGTQWQLGSPRLDARVDGER